jgi:Ser/Thr protein kinase RdoA (MazF antagonist)
MRSDPIRHVLGEYGEPFASAELKRHASTGLSGAELWRGDIGGGRYVLRRWPDGQMSAPRLAWIHGVLRRAFDAGIDFLPVPLTTPSGSSFIEFDGTHFQLEPWLAGQAHLTDPPRLEMVAAAVEALARFHEGASCVAAGPRGGGETHHGRSPALVARSKLLDEMLAGGIERIRTASGFVAPREPWAGIAMTVRLWLAELPGRAAALRLELAAPSAVERNLSPVLRDLTRDHVLFTGATVSGLVDFGAMADDLVAVDLARLAGSYGGDASIKDYIWNAYRVSKHARALTDSDRGLIDLLDRSGVLVAAYRWLRWIFVEERRFTDPEAVVRRIGSLIARDRLF